VHQSFYKQPLIEIKNVNLSGTKNMETKVKYHSSQLRDYSSLFSRNEVLSWLKMDFSSIDYKIKRYDGKWLKSNKLTYLDYLKHVYSVLASNYQNEYIFKNQFLNEWLISEIGEDNSIIFNEFRVGNSVADLVMFNGKSKVFEIKTEFDSDFRLPIQLESYKKVFNEIYLIIPEIKLSIYEKYDESIGLITYNSKNKNLFKLNREASKNQKIDTKTLMSILHTNEYKSIVKKYFGALPEMTSFSQFKICNELICKIPLKELNKLFIDEIKKRGDNEALSSRYYKEFNQLFLALKMNQTNKKKMIDLLKTPLQFK
jgi:hypothetical protein